MSSYLVIARKWRPGLFEEIVGQEHVTRTLRNAVSSGRIAQAYLFSGPRGVGKTTAARILSRALNCEKGPTPEPCGACGACRSITSGSSVDVFEIDGASNTSVDNVRELRESVRYVPTQGRYKIYIIDEVHMLSTSAFNALLKTLEEPPPHAVFIFATTEVHKIPLTIVSRCQRFDFRRIPLKEIQGRLKKILVEEKIPFEEDALFNISREAEGSLRDAQSLLDQVLAFSGGEVKVSDVANALGLMDRTVLVDLVEAIVKRDARVALNIVENIYDFGYDLKRACGDLLEYIRDLSVIKVSGAGLLDLPDSEAARLEGIASGAAVERLQMLFGVLSRGYEEVSRSAQPRYSFEMAVIRAAICEDVVDLSSLAERIEGLARRLGSGGAPSGGAVSGSSGGAKRPAGPVGAPAARTAAKDAPREATAKHGAGADSRVSGDKPAPGEVPSAREEDGAYGKAGLGGFLEFLGRKNDYLAKALSSVEASLDGDVLNIVAGKGYYEVLGLKKDSISRLCLEFFGRNVRVELALSGRPEQEKNPVDPILKEAVRVLGGKVIEDRRRQNVQTDR